MSDFAINDFLTAYGYIDPGETDAGKIEVAIGDAQTRYGLPVTGYADPMTVKVLDRTPRCGRPDVEEHKIGMPHWGKAIVTWDMSMYPIGTGLTKQQVDAALDRAFASWASNCGLRFQRVSGAPADITMSIGRGPRANFDGAGGTLAWMEVCPREDFIGQLNGLFDAEEAWAIEGRGILIENVACHEIGHALGLMHSKRSDQLMSPTYSSRVPAPLAEDIVRIQQLYGPSTGTQPPVTPPPTPGVIAPTKAQVLMSDNSVYEFREPPVRLR